MLFYTIYLASVFVALIKYQILVGKKNPAVSITPSWHYRNYESLLHILRCFIRMEPDKTASVHLQIQVFQPQHY